MDIREFNKGSGAQGIVAPKIITGAGTPKEQLGDNKVTAPSAAIETATAETPMTDLPSELVKDLVIKEYREYLEEEGIGDQEIMTVLDALITTGNVAWNFMLFGKIPVEFQMRAAWVNEYILTRLENDFPKSAHRFADTVGGYNLAASIRSYGDATFAPVDLESFVAVHKAVMNMPFVVQNALIKKLAVFDRVVAVATSDWAVEKFMKPQEGE